MSYFNRQHPVDRPVLQGALGSTDYRDGKIPGSGDTISWENPSFSWWNDPLGRREDHYLRDRAAYYTKLKADQAAGALSASARQTLETLNAAFDAAKHGGVALPPGSPPSAFAPRDTSSLLPRGLTMESATKLAAVGLLGVGAFILLRRRR